MSRLNIIQTTKKRNIVNIISLLAWMLAMAGYFLQFPFYDFSKFIVPSLFVYLCLQLPKAKILNNKKYIALVALFLFFLLFAAIRSLAIGIEFKRMLRFAAIFFSVPLCFCIHDDDFQSKKEIFLNIAMAKSLIIILFGLIIVYYGNFEWLRNWCHQYELGDIYFLNRLIPKVQVKGNTLLLIAFMLDFLVKKKFTLRNVVLLCGVLVAGNFAYILGLLLFAVWLLYKKVIKLIEKNKKTKWIALGLVSVAMIAFSVYVAIKIKEKAEYSNVVRIEQALILLKANPLIGDGLGAWVTANTENLKYNGDIYFELQTLYIYKQIGVIGLGLFYAITFIPIFYKGKTKAIFYLIYIFVSFWNPYCFDSTQMITILLIMNTDRLGETNDKSSYYSLLPCRLGKRKHT